MRLRRRLSADPSLALPIETSRLLLRDFVSRDLEAVHAYSSAKEVTRYLIWGPNTLLQSKQTIRAFLDDQKERPRINFDLAIVRKGTTRRGDEPKLIGGVGLKLVDWDNRTADIGYVLHPDYWGQGYALEAAQGLAAAGFRDLGLQRIVATCDQRNKASARVMERLGMRREGSFRRSKYIQGGWRDEFLYALLAEEFYV
ncbi:GCN5-related N-acetyltransferase [Parvibaculum lavamentivorans DS-1]|uniref:GCN5-related N-acetyltransferase n=1 Tax=Parvibaculum lavamentivorans (strain DS-1 / DSM 13023 / NCIMB 13966) TaxID=402881 RepID=A7HTM9_PARL1|nr:GNAT family protein [Parvibaculum lavamentivorans]ABS63262.1 GCN5-related N-acetyltransferase [Parvibaculum lavamentivorans DS-1]